MGEFDKGGPSTVPSGEKTYLNETYGYGIKKYDGKVSFKRGGPSTVTSLGLRNMKEK